MKKFVLILLVFSSVFACFASQQLFTQDCEEVQVLYRLFREGRAVMPSYVFPVTGDVLLDVINYTGIEKNLCEESVEILNGLIAKFEGKNVLKRYSDDFAFDADASVALQMWLPSTDKENIFKNDYEYQEGYNPIYTNNRIPAFLKGGVDLFLTKYAVGHFEYEYSKNFEEYCDDKFQTNLPFDNDRNSTVPYNTYLNVGLRKLNLFAGRVRNSSGTGVTGNLAVGDNFLFRNTLKAQINALPFSYEIVVNRFDAEVFDEAYSTKYGNTTASNLTHISKLDTAAPMVVMHKANFMFGKRFSIGLYEAVMEYSKATIADPKLLGPFNLMHNLLSYQYDTNNFFGFDFDWLVGKGLNLHGEMIFDQIQLTDEKDKKVPGAWGALLNGQYTKRTKNSYFTLYAEGVYTSPWLYLKPANDYSSTEDNYYTLDLIVGNFHSHDARTDTGYIGYKYGPNTLAFSTGLKWDMKKNSVNVDVLLKFNGNTGLNRATDKTQTGKTSYVEASTPSIFGDGKAQNLIQLSVSDRFDCFGNGVLKLNAAAGVQFYHNYNCVKDENFSNFVFGIGAIFHPLNIKRK